MPGKRKTIKVFVASPSDVNAERKRVQKAISNFNDAWSEWTGIALDFVGWETDTHPGFGTDAQDVINKQIPATYDIFIGIMWGRFGSPTGRARSGTEEEFQIACKRFEDNPDSVEIMMYFKTARLSYETTDPSQLESVRHFRDRVRRCGLCAEFKTSDQFYDLMQIHIPLVLQRRWLPPGLAARYVEAKEHHAILAVPDKQGVIPEDQLGREYHLMLFHSSLEFSSVIMRRITDRNNEERKLLRTRSAQVQAIGASAADLAAYIRNFNSYILSRVSDLREYSAFMKSHVVALRGTFRQSTHSLSTAVHLSFGLVLEGENGRNVVFKSLVDLRKSIAMLIVSVEYARTSIHNGRILGEESMHEIRDAVEAHHRATDLAVATIDEYGDVLRTHERMLIEIENAFRLYGLTTES